MHAECNRMLVMRGRHARARHPGSAVVATLLLLLALGAFAGAASAHIERIAVGITTSTETTTSAPPTTSDTTAPAETSTTEETTTESTTTETTPAVTATIQLTTTTTQAGLSPGGAAVVGAAAATSSDDSDTQWGWIAFGILAAAVIIFGIVLLVRRSRR